LMLCFMLYDLQFTIYNLGRWWHTLNLSIVNCKLSILLLFVLPASAYAHDDGNQQSTDDFTVEVLLALKYERCLDALNLLVDRERAEDTLSAQHRYLMAEAFSCLGSPKSALRIYNNLLKRDKENPQYLYKRAMLYAQLQRWKKAHAGCMQLRRLMPRELSYCKICGEVALEAERYSDALSLLSCHLQAHTHDVDAQYLVAQALLRMKSYHSALLTINECIAARPQMGAYHLLRAQVYEQQGVLSFAADGYAVYLKQFPADHKMWLQYGRLLQKLERKGEMCRAFEQSKANGSLDAGKLLHRFCR